MAIRSSEILRGIAEQRKQVTVYGQEGPRRLDRRDLTVVSGPETTAKMNGPIYGTDGQGRLTRAGDLSDGKWTVHELPRDYDPDTVGLDVAPPHDRFGNPIR